MTQAKTAGPAASRGLGATERKDPWWIGPVATGLGFGAFIIYATFRAFYNADYRLGMLGAEEPDGKVDHGDIEPAKDGQHGGQLGGLPGI